ncbi:beta-ketoacyl-[acyl-carrier-protein] synthase family protein [Streptomyces argenteolus]|uniref:Beta-ketoacyl-[acyl-carrier-protein] synthase family protein n=1 Tax=Streptomyces argenteolus TaxID=67274 RepID=A0ABW6XEH1_9ACTN
MRPSEQFDVAVTGIGLITPAGIGTEQTWETLCEGTPTAGPVDVLADLPVPFASTVPDFAPAALIGPGARRLDRFSQLAVAAARQAVDDAALDREAWVPNRVGVVLGNGFGGLDTWGQQFERLARGARYVSPLTVPMAISNIAAAQITIDLGIGGPSLTVSTACAAGATALGVSVDLLRAGRCDTVIAGAAEAAVLPVTATAFDRLHALSRRADDPSAASRPFDRERDGFVLGEGAGVLILERREQALARGRSPYAVLAGFGASSDAHHPTDPDPGGAGMRRAVEEALRDADLCPQDIAHVNAHASSTPTGDAVEARMITEIFPDGIPVTANKGVLGHLLGAAGAVEAAVTALSISRGIVPPSANFGVADPGSGVNVVHGRALRRPIPAAVSHSFGFGGHNAAIVLVRP